jgi:hypothetical protein
MDCVMVRVYQRFSSYLVGPVNIGMGCKDKEDFRDVADFACTAWRGFDCLNQASQWYPQDAQVLADNCPFSCGLCPSAVVSGTSDRRREEVHMEGELKRRGDGSVYWKLKSERREYLTPKSSTTKTKGVERDECLKRQGLDASKKAEKTGEESRRRFESLPASLRPYIQSQYRHLYAPGPRRHSVGGRSSVYSNCAGSTSPIQAQ